MCFIRVVDGSNALYLCGVGGGFAGGWKVNIGTDLTISFLHRLSLMSVSALAPWLYSLN